MNVVVVVKNIMFYAGKLTSFHLFPMRKTLLVSNKIGKTRQSKADVNELKTRT